MIRLDARGADRGLEYGVGRLFSVQFSPLVFFAFVFLLALDFSERRTSTTEGPTLAYACEEKRELDNGVTGGTLFGMVTPCRGVTEMLPASGSHIPPADNLRGSDGRSPPAPFRSQLGSLCNQLETL